MPRLWIHHDPHQWTIVPLDRDPIGVAADRLCPVVSNTPVTHAVLATKVDADNGQWAVIVRAGEEETVHVNGDRVLLGIRALRNHDAVQISGGERIYFSTDSAPAVAPYPTGKAPVPCARCGTLINSGDTAVKCPKCGAYFHQRPEIPCWLYTDHCGCGQPTAMNEENCWRPDEP